MCGNGELDVSFFIWLVTFLFVWLVIHLSIYLVVYLCVYFIVRSFVHVYINSLAYLFMHFYLFIYSLIYLYVYSSIYLFIYSFIYLFCYLSIYLFIRQSMYTRCFHFFSSSRQNGLRLFIGVQQKWTFLSHQLFNFGMDMTVNTWASKEIYDAVKQGFFPPRYNCCLNNESTVIIVTILRITLVVCVSPTIIGLSSLHSSLIICYTLSVLERANTIYTVI